MNKSRKSSTSARVRGGMMVWKLLLVVLGCLVAAPADAVAGHSGLRAPEHDAESDNVIAIVKPATNRVFRHGSVHVAIRLSSDALPDSLEVQLNGKDVTDLFFTKLACGTGLCEEAHFPESDLAPGLNILNATVEGSGLAVHGAQCKFTVQGRPGVNGNTVTHAPSSVRVISSWLQGDDLSAMNKYVIVVGPGPNFTQQTYNAANLKCGAGLNSMQVLVLNRRTLAPLSGPNQPAQACFADAGSLQTFLKSLPTGAIVIASGFNGLMANVNTTAIGGTDYSTKNPHVDTYGYTIIGVAGTPAGTAYESYHWLPNAYPPDLTGSLTLDTSGNYSYVPFDHPIFEVIPNDPDNGGKNSITINSTRIGTKVYLSPNLPAGVSGGFWMLVLNRHYAQIEDNFFFATNGPDASRQVQNLVFGLTNTPSEYMFILTAVGTPMTPGQLTYPLWNAINLRGGNGYDIAKLATASNTGAPHTYTLISSTDPSYPKSAVVVNSSLFATDQEPRDGSVRGLFALDRQNLFVPKMWAQESRHPSDDVAVNYRWYQVAYQLPQDWPLPVTPAQQQAYQDISGQITERAPYSQYGLFGCDPETSTACEDVRSFYDGGLGGTGSTPLCGASGNYAALKRPGTATYPPETFEQIRQQLINEAQYVCNVYVLYGQANQFTLLANNNIIWDVQTAAQEIIDDLTNGDESRRASIAWTTTAVPIIRSIFSAAPGGAALGFAASIPFSVQAYLYSNPQAGVPTPEFDTTLADMKSKASNYGANTTRSLIALFSGIVNDWGKLSRAGGNWGSQKPGWYWCYSCPDTKKPIDSLPLFRAQLRRNLYNRLLPTVYSLDQFYAPQDYGRNISNPKSVGGWLPGYDAPYCASAYSLAPDGAWTSYPNAGGPGKWDLFIVTATARSGPSYNLQLNFPTGPLLANLFSVPSSDGTGGLDFIRDQLFFPGGILPNRAGYVPGVLGICYAQ